MPSSKHFMFTVIHSIVSFLAAVRFRVHGHVLSNRSDFRPISQSVRIHTRTCVFLSPPRTNLRVTERISAGLANVIHWPSVRIAWTGGQGRPTPWSESRRELITNTCIPAVFSQLGWAVITGSIPTLCRQPIIAGYLVRCLRPS